MQHIGYTEICKAIRSQMSEDINNDNEEPAIKSIEDNTCLNSTKRRKRLVRNNIISLKEEKDARIHDRNRMIKRCEEMYTNLYSTKLSEGQPSLQIHRNTLIYLLIYRLSIYMFSVRRLWEGIMTTSSSVPL